MDDFRLFPEPRVFRPGAATFPLAGFAAPPNQGEDDRIWWDDVVVEKIWEAPR